MKNNAKQLHLKSSRNKMSTPKIFKYQNYIALSYGFSCFEEKSVIKKIILHIIKLCSSLYIIQEVVGTIVVIFSDKGKGLIFPLLFNILSYLCFVVIFFKLRKVVESFSNFEKHSLNPSRKQSLSKFDLVLFVCYIVVVILLIIIETAYHTITIFHPENDTFVFERRNYWINEPQSSVSYQFLYRFLFSILNVMFSQSYLSGSVFILFHLINILNAIYRSFFDRIIKNKDRIKELRLKWLQIKKLKNDLEDNLNLIPFLTSATLFLDVTATVTIFNQSYDHEFLQIDLFNLKFRYFTQWAVDFIIAVNILSVLILVSRVEKRLSRHLDIIEYVLYRDHEISPGFESFISEVRTNLDMNLTGYGMFKLNKEFVLGFISSVITFSVLVLQLTQKSGL